MVQISSHFENKTNTAHTATYTLEELDGKHCRFHLSIGFLPDGCLWKLDIWRRGEFLKEFAECTFKKRLNEFKVEAERRYGLQQFPESAAANGHINSQ